MNPNEPGAMIVKTWDELPKRFPFLHLDAKVLMPNHFHPLVFLDRRGESCIRPVEDHQGMEMIRHKNPGIQLHEGKPFG